MRFMIQIKSDKAAEAGELPSQEILTAMGKYNDELIKAGVLLGGEGLQPSSQGARVTFANGKTTVTDGPFAEAKELIAGFWLIDVKSKEEAVEWAKRCPHPEADREMVLEIRKVFEVDDFGDAATPELREQERRLRAHGL